MCDDAEPNQHPQRDSRKSLTPSYTHAVMMTDEAVQLRDKQLMRGILSCDVLHRFGQILQNSEGSAKTYSLSQPVYKLNSFISHNWSVNRWLKFMVLAMHFNFRWALVAMLFSGFLFFLLIVYAKVSWSPFLSLSGIGFFFVFMSMFLFASYIPCLRHHRAFLDKSCIHQTDSELMKEGIQSLAAFLTRSSSMIIVLGPEYLSKIWTVYELATFLLVNPNANVYVIPLFLPILVITCTAVSCLLSIAYTMNKDFKFMDYGGTGPLFVVLFSIFSFISRRWSLIREYFYQEISKFDLRSSKCFVESDRELVIANVEAFMLSSGLAGRPDYLVEDFNAIVKATMPGVIDDSLGRHGLRYRVAFAICCPLILIQMPYIWINHKHSEELLYRIAGLFGSAALGLPNGLALIYFLNTKVRQLVFGWLSLRWRVALVTTDFLYTFFVSLVGCAFAVSANPVWKGGTLLGLPYVGHLVVTLYIYRHGAVHQSGQIVKHFQKGLTNALDSRVFNSELCHPIGKTSVYVSVACQTQPDEFKTQAPMEEPPLSAVPTRVRL